MSNLLIARTFYPFQKCCADAIFVPHYFEISIFHMKRPKIKTQSLVYLATAEICIMVGSSSPLEESFLASERFNVELFFLHCYVKIVIFHRQQYVGVFVSISRYLAGLAGRKICQ